MLKLRKPTRFEAFIMLLSFLLVMKGCASVEFRGRADNPIDPVFDQYVEDFKRLKKKYTKSEEFTKDLSIQFFTLQPPAIGVCYWNFDGTREIYIDPGFWFRRGTREGDRRVLMFHELGHCDLDRRHNDPSSIMESSHIGWWNYDDDPTYYNNELFDESVRRVVKKVRYKGLKVNGGKCEGIKFRDKDGTVSTTKPKHFH